MILSVILGSESDKKVMQPCFDLLNDFRIKYAFKVISAHRNPDKLKEYILHCEERETEVFIAGAGLAAALPGAVASHTIKPVIGVPLSSGALNGVDSLYSIVQMPPGIPVATVGINASKNAALLACQILAMDYPAIRDSLKTFREEMRK